MLPAATRLTRRDEFATAMRRGRRAARGSVVVHLARIGAVDAPQLAGRTASHPVTTGPKVGFVVGRAVGGSVIRHRVQRQLRHLMRSRLGILPSDALVVVRALPAAAGASSAALGDDLDAALRRLIASRTTPSPAAVSSGGRQ